MRRSTTASRTTVRFRRDVFDRLVEPLGHTGLAAKAKFIGCSRNTLWRMSTGVSAPSGEFMARVARALPCVPITQLFDFGGERGADQAA